MVEVKNFDNWIIDNDKLKYGSGASDKVWLISPDGKESGIFKYPKIRVNGNITGEYWAEKLSTDIAKILDIKCAKVDIGTFNR